MLYLEGQVRHPYWSYVIVKPNYFIMKLQGVNDMQEKALYLSPGSITHCVLDQNLSIWWSN